MASVCFGTGAAVVLGWCGQAIPFAIPAWSTCVSIPLYRCRPLTLKRLCVSCLGLTCNWLILCEQLKQQYESFTLQIQSQKLVE